MELDPATDCAMNPEILDKVLSCKQLPSLPAVAARVIELTSQQNVQIRDLADTIANDQGLAAKVLRTVNSSFYGLRKPCGTINQAIVMLGLSAVKTLALGFSLVDGLSKVRTDAFDMRAYWRRSLVSGIAAKCIAAEARLGQDEECFLGGLLQDVGVIAMLIALGSEYTEVLAEAGADHSALIKAESSHLEVTHPEVGAMLASRWKLPNELVMPVRFHEKPTAAPQEHIRHVQAVALGNSIADVVASSEPGLAMKRLYERGEQWFKLKPAQIDSILKQVTQGAAEVARLLKVDAGVIATSAEIIDKARQQLDAMALPFAGGPQVRDLDPQTGLPTRESLIQNLIAAFERCNGGQRPFAVAVMAIDQLDGLHVQGAHLSEAALAAASRAIATMVKDRALLTRFDQRHLALFIADVDRTAATRFVEAVRQAVSRDAISLEPRGLQPIPVTLTLSVGLAAVDPTTRDRLVDLQAVLDVVQQALAAAQRSGANNLRVYAPRAAAA